MIESTKEAPVAEQEKTEQQIVNDKRRAAYQKAASALRIAHKDEFDTLYEQACAEAGVPFKKRLTPEERAAETLRVLAAEYPDLAKKVLG